MPQGRPRIRQEGDICEDCGVEPVRFKGYSVAGVERWDKRCVSCHKGNYNFPWLKHRKEQCEMCDHRPFFRGSLDVHHRDGDKGNNDPSNLMTLCASCHREIHGFFNQTKDYKKAESMLRKFMNSLLG